MYKILIPLLLSNSLLTAEDSNTLEFGVKTRFYNYTEKDTNNQILNTEKSSTFDIGGIYASYDYKLKNISAIDGTISHYLNMYASYESGYTQYLGSTLEQNDACDEYGCLES